MKTTPQIFLSYAREDREKVESFYQRLSDAGFKPWMDKDILPGQRWQSRIRQAIRRSDFFLACLSANSINKRGWIQKEIKQALEIWQEKLEDDIYLIPVRLEECEVPEILCDFQWVDLFDKDGWTWLVKAIQIGMGYRAEAPADEEPPSATEMATPKEGLESGVHAGEIIAAKSSKPTIKLPPHIEMTLRYGSTDMGLAAIGDLGDLVRYDNTRASLARERLEQLRDNQDDPRLSTKAAEVLETLARKQLIARLEQVYRELNKLVEQKAWSKALSLAEDILANKPDFRDVSSLKLLIEAEVALEQDNYQEAIRLAGGIKRTLGRVAEWQKSIHQSAEAKGKAKAEAERKAKEEADRLAAEKARTRRPYLSRTEQIVYCLSDLHASNPDIEASAVVCVDPLKDLPDAVSIPPEMVEVMVEAFGVTFPEAHLLLASYSPHGVEEDTLTLSAARLVLLGQIVAAQLERGAMKQTYIRGKNGYIILQRIDVETVLIILASANAHLNLLWLDTSRTAEELSILL